MVSKFGSHNGETSADEKMGKYQDRDAGTWIERYQRLAGTWRQPHPMVKKVTKKRAARKRRQHGKREITIYREAE